MVRRRIGGNVGAAVVGDGDCVGVWLMYGGGRARVSAYSQCVGLLLGLHLGREPSRGDLRARLYGQRLRARDRKQPEDVRFHQGEHVLRACNR